MSKNGTNLSFPSIPPALPDNEVHLWLVSLNLTQTRLDVLTGWLSGDEKERANKFRYTRDQNRFIASHGLLREILGAYTQQVPQALAFSRTAYGKPSLVDATEQNAIQFNISHSGDFALFGVVRGEEIGVDIEHIRENINLESLAHSIFSPPEIEEWKTVSIEQQQNAFYAFWTRKEAYVKALGTGLSHSLNSFAVSLTNHDVVILENNPPKISPFYVSGIDFGKEYIGAFAIKRNNWRVRHFAI